MAQPACAEHNRHRMTLMSFLALATLGLIAAPAVLAQDDQKTGAQTVATTTDADVDLAAVLSKAAPESVAELRALGNRVHEIVEKVTPATVGVRVGGAQGSGVIVTADGYVMTAGHVSGQPGRRATIIFPDGRQVRGETLGHHADMDSGLVKITEEGEWPHVDLGKSDGLKNGAWVISLGHPGGYQRGRQPVVRLGRVLDNARTGIRTDCTLVGGDSGGPLFDMDGKVIGIHSRISRQLSQNFHVPVDTYTETWDRLAASEEIGVEPPRLGVRGVDHAQGCEVTEVLDNAPALAAGVKVGDIITRLGETEVQGIDHLAQLVQQRRRGRDVELTLLRDGQEMTVTVTIR